VDHVKSGRTAVVAASDQCSRPPGLPACTARCRGSLACGPRVPVARVTAAERQGAIRLVSVTSSSAHPLGVTVQLGGTVRPGKHGSRTER
jgi:hypothetical protein